MKNIIIISCCILSGLFFSLHCGFAAEAVDGIIEPSVTVKFGTNSTGIIKNVYVDRGDFIKKDQILVTLESGVEAATVRQIRELLALAKRKQSRNRELAQKDLISKQEIDEIETDARQLEAQLHEASARLRLKEIRSTIGGTYQGQVTLVDKVMDAASGTFGARILLPNPDHRIPAGIKCTVQWGDEN